MLSINNHSDSTQIFFLSASYSANTYILIRKKTNGGSWTEEWANPPMVVGREYRTTERWNEVPVYTMLAYLGTTTESMSGMIPLDAPGTIVRAVPQLGTSVCTNWPIDAAINTANKFYFVPERFDAGVTYYVTCGTNRVGYDLHVQIWYTKV